MKMLLNCILSGVLQPESCTRTGSNISVGCSSLLEPLRQVLLRLLCELQSSLSEEKVKTRDQNMERNREVGRYWARKVATKWPQLNLAARTPKRLDLHNRREERQLHKSRQS